MALVTRGKTFGATETVTNTNLHQLVDSATVTAIVSANFTLTSTNPVHIGTSAPSSPDQRPWYDTTNDVFRIKDNAGEYQPVSRGHLYTNQSGGTLAAGDVVIIDTANDNAVTTTTTANDPLVFGVTLVGGADTAEVIIVTEGFCPVVNVTGSTVNGDYLSTSTTAKKADPSTAFGSGSFARAMSTSSSSVTAQLGGATMVQAGSGAKFTAAGVSANTIRTHATAAGALNVAHNCGAAPSEIRVHGTVYDGSTARACTGSCVVVGGSFTQSCNSGGVDRASISGKVLSLHSSSGALIYEAAVTAVDATNIQLTWNKTGSPAGDTNFIITSTV